MTAPSEVPALYAEIDRLRAEGDALREALEKVAAVSGMSAATLAKGIARAALLKVRP